MKCKLCSTESNELGRALVLNKYEAEYLKCPKCGFIQPKEAAWLNEAYTNAITKSDIGMISRNTMFARITAALISVSFDPNGKFVDYGGGYGVFVRLMRDAGYDFYRQDKFCDNLFAQQFEADDAGSGQYELLTAFEVFEHLPDPLPEIEKILSYSRNILFSTVLVPQPAPALGEWWYYGLEHGQHVALYTREALQVIARRYDLHLCSDGKELHLLSEKAIPSQVFRLIARPKIAAILRLALKRPSLLHADYARLTGQSIR